jgi:heme A synthase
LPDAEKKIDTMVAEVRQSADEARKTAASVSIYTFLSMLIGAFIASAAAALGGQERYKPYPRLGK